MLKCCCRTRSIVTNRFDLDFEKLPLVMLERQRILQVIVNLLKNAKDALTAGRRENRQLIVRAGRQNEWLKIEIEDNGVGIAQDDLNQYLLTWVYDQTKWPRLRFAQLCQHDPGNGWKSDRKKRWTRLRCNVYDRRSLH